MAFAVTLLISITAIFDASGKAGADLTNGPTTLSTPAGTTMGTVTAGSPYTSGEIIAVTVAANSTMNNTALTAAGVPTAGNFYLLECTDTNGTLPSGPTNCEAATVITAAHGSDGSMSASGVNGFTVYDLPDSSLGAPTMTGKCDVVPNQCVVGIFSQNPGVVGAAAFSTPHLFSAAFNVDVGDGADLGHNPGDGSAPTQTQTSATNSIMAASSTTVVANGANSSMVTVTLMDTNNHPVTTPKSVTLSQGSGHSTIKVNGTAGSTTTTDSGGQAVFTVSDATAETVTYSATDTTDSLSLTHTATVMFTVPVATPANSSIAALSTTVPQGGNTTVTVTLKDQGAPAQPITGKTIALSQGGGHSTIAPASTGSATTNANGQATFTVSDSIAETVTYSANDATDAIALTGQSASVTFGTLTVSATDSTVTTMTPIVSTVANSGPQPTGSVIVTLLDGSSPVAGKTVALHASSTNAVITPGTKTTDINGRASFAVSDTTAETATFNVVDTTDNNLAIVATTQVGFQVPQPSPSSSSMSATPTTVTADGVTASSLTVRIEDQFGNPLAGKTVTVAGKVAGTSNPSTTKVVPSATIGSVVQTTTNDSGIIDFNAFDTTAESVTLTATDTTDGITVAQTVGVTFTPGIPQVDQSSVQANPTSVPANGSTPSTITVTIEDHNANPVPGKAITLAALSGSSVVTPGTGMTTDSSGQAIFHVTDATDENVRYRATDTSDNLPLVGKEVDVTFGSPPPITPVVADSDIVANPTTVPADGRSSATVVVILNDGNGLPIAGKAVALFPTSGNASPSPASATSDSNGMATFSVTDRTAENATLTATDTTDHTPLTGLSVTISFTPAGLATSSNLLNKPVVGMASDPDPGYWLVASDGGIFNYGGAAFQGSTGAIRLNSPVVGMAATPDGKGYWLVASDGGIFSYGDAAFYGSTGGLLLNKPIVGMAATPDGKGYWLVASDGGIFSYGDASFFGSTGGIPLNKPVVGMAATPDGRGYWLVASDGGIFNYGDTSFFGSSGGIRLNKPVVGMAATPDGRGYWLVASDGGIFNYGDASFFGSSGGIRLNKPVVGIAATPDGRGYWLVASDGGIFNYGDAPFDGSVPG